MSIFLNNVKVAISELIAPGDRVLVAVSGGADSVALLFLLEQFSKELGYELYVAHLNHLARGKESDEDADFVVRLAEKLSLPIIVDKIDAAEKKTFLKTSFQESARILRYQFLEKTLMSIKGNKIALGHTADDRVETVLMNLLRGAGIKGLVGIPEVRGNVIRPLLSFNRADLEMFLEERKLVYRIDSTNKETKYLRNKIRHELIPYLKTFNREISGNLLSMSEIAHEEDLWMSEKTHELYNQLVTSQNGGLCIEVAKFENQPLAMKRRLVREVFYRLKGNFREITAFHVKQVLDLFALPKVGSSIMLPGSVRVVCGYEMMCFSKTDVSQPPEIDKQARKLKIPGVTSLAQIRLQLHARFVNPPLPESIDQKQAYLDYDRTGELIQVRFFQPGDRFIPLGMQGHKKVKSYFIDQKVPREERPFIPILTNADNDIIWVYGERISDPFRAAENTKKVLLIEGKGL
ncbi:MAG: tRNA lysidine(34) synthetase TilS [Nitrospinae bacterium]|nr:tRNA lysidine(34) synthetase TilS [Nitrospinota bacterium]